MVPAEELKQHRRNLKQHQAESAYVTKRIEHLKDNDIRMAESANIYDMTIDLVLLPIPTLTHQ